MVVVIGVRRIEVVEVGKRVNLDGVCVMDEVVIGFVGLWIGFGVVWDELVGVRVDGMGWVVVVGVGLWVGVRLVGWRRVGRVEGRVGVVL